ncbi:carbohydrate kinase family protein [Streptomyces sp. BH097]|uniref:carbohydrate kinase family protein n=1 Tax=unclassified Streptomyces TaxID=2593676 RepID=UPI003BB4FF5B
MVSIIVAPHRPTFANREGTTVSPSRAVCDCIDPLAGVRATGDPEHDVFLTGTVFMDLVFTGLDGAPRIGTENWARGMGSSPGGIANMTTALSRLGLRTTLAATFGTDLYGDYCWESLADVERVDLTHSRRLPGWHSPLTVSMAYDGERTMVTHEHPAPPLEHTVPRARAGVASLEPDREDAWLRQAHEQGARIFADVGWDESGRWDTATLTGLPYAHAFLPNATEALHYTRTDTPDDAVARLAELVPIAVVTKGPEGAVAVDSLTGEHADVPGLRVEALDPTGAGDVFMAGFVTGTLAGWPLADRLAFANLTAALSVQHFGGSLSAPGWVEVAAWWGELTARAKAGDAAATDLAGRYGFLHDLVPARLHEVARRRATPTLGFRAA